MAETVITEPKATPVEQTESFAATSPNGEEIPLEQLNEALDKLWDSMRGVQDALARVETRLDRILAIFEKAG